MEKLVHRTPTQIGDSLLVRSGRIHAIDAGNLILEIQQNSDTTYRVYDWGRVGLDGLPRDLHVEQSLRCIDFQDFEPELLTDDPDLAEQTLTDCEEFRIRRFRLAPRDRISFPAGQEPRLIHLVSGEAKAGEVILSKGDTALVPFAANVEIEAAEAIVLLVTDGFLPFAGN